MTSPTDEELYGQVDNKISSAVAFNLQRYIWQDTLNYILHPHILSVANTFIADLGTGTGIWPVHLARVVPPNCILHGYDRSDARFIHAVHLPDNVDLEILDVTKEIVRYVPDYYDVVHIQSMQTMVDNDNPELIIDNCSAMLKKGGFLQWDEFDLAAEAVSNEFVTGPRSVSAISEYMKEIKPFTWIQALPSILRRKGFRVAVVERRRENKWQRGDLVKINAILLEDFAQHLERREEGEKASELRDLIREAVDEGYAGAYASKVFQVVVAQKPWS